jgi:hypothetical protein
MEAAHARTNEQCSLVLFATLVSAACLPPRPTAAALCPIYTTTPYSLPVRVTSTEASTAAAPVGGCAAAGAGAGAGAIGALTGAGAGAGATGAGAGAGAMGAGAGAGATGADMAGAG